MVLDEFELRCYTIYKNGLTFETDQIDPRIVSSKTGYYCYRVIDLLKHYCHRVTGL